MLIGKGQIDAFEIEILQQLHARMFRFISDSFPEACDIMGRKETQKLIVDGIRKAHGYNLMRECDVAAFLSFLLLLSPTFDQEARLPWAKSILHSKLEAPARIQKLWEYTHALLREAQKVTR